ncbi:hypothetical protein GCM10011490_03570 [Pseudoclavibacter endophyticus]|uniref:DUF885 domain-containing protein n=1 Tax=Pseudoclavibacter endophyticus TaxID=1778590 RepID=A0A6H9WVA3_9MICO|nr:DUF885 domain-containing protein [Pseudoclavibacter endophyticus]KAB1650120.1 DUF885 domain-containing protein [Pseudoclavibacter endophyticus]GGA57057.1 hypothetical protein GCM10011490_03570 [Pseudoclavibacter endophyticus]
MIDDAPRPQTDIDRVAEEWMGTEVQLEPERRVELGLPGDQSEYGDLSPDRFEARREAVTATLRRLDDASPVDEVDRVTLLELRRTLRLALDELAAGVGYRDLNNIASPAQAVRMVFDLMPSDTDDDRAAIARRMANIPAALGGYLETLREGVRRGIVPARRQVAEVVAQVREYAKPDGFFATLAVATGSRSGIGAAASLAVDLERGAAAAQRAYADLADVLARELAPVAAETDAVGREHYALASRSFLGAEIDLDETYEWGLDELARMTGEQEAVANELVPGGTVADAIARLEGDPSRKLHGTEALRAWMQETSDRAIDELGRTHFDITAPMRTLECRIAPTQEGAIYYTGPNDDFSRPGRMWWSVAPGVTAFDTWRELTTVYHEGVPGHHLQIAHAIARKDHLNSWRRNNWTSGHGEGWALYAERLMAQLGYLDDPADRLGMLDAQRMRAARVVLDIGVHLGKRVPASAEIGVAQVWDHDVALEFLRRNVNMPDAFVRFEVNRYFGWPGQAPSYKVGQRIWEEVRARAEAARGAAFDLRAWHTRALDLGGVGLDTLRTVVAR